MTSHTPEERKKQHGLSGGKLYRAFHLIKQRCNNPKAQNYSRYGGRGIKCHWDSFESFRNDMQDSFAAHVADYGEKQTTIDRIDGEKGYSKENCRWATYKEQNDNRKALKNTVYVTIDGETRKLSDWTNEIGMNITTYYWRISAGWTPKRALFTPVRPLSPKGFKKKAIQALITNQD